MGRFHRLLRIDLSRKKQLIEEIPASLESRLLGGKGLGTAYLCREIAPGADPLGPENRFIVATGPLNASVAPASSRYEVLTKSPLTGLYADSNAGGHFAHELKSCGFDLLILEGVASSPVTLHIQNDKVRFIEAGDLWGASVYDTETQVRRQVKDPATRVMSIGPAGENKVSFASISNDYSRQAARGGGGAVLGAKKVKAIAVRGTRDIPIVDLGAHQQAARKAMELIFSNPWVPEHRRYGTPRTVGPANAAGLMPVCNFRKGSLESVDSIDQYAFEKLASTKLSCSECPVACAKIYRREEIRLEGPEYETIDLFGPNLGVLDAHAIAEFNYLCNQYGLDTISAGGLIAALLDSRGQIGAEGVRELVLDLLEQITYRRGEGDILAKGPRAAAEELGLSSFVAEIKGMGIPAYDPRGSEGTALAYMTADRGACHLRAWPLGRELSRVLGEEDLEAKVRFVKEQQEDKAAEESLIVCQFPYGIGLLDPILAELLNTATGESWDLMDMRLAGERIWNLSRLFNVREGISREQDYLPVRFTIEGIRGGPLEGRKIPRQKQDQMLDLYYLLRGWTRAGVPTPETLNRLDIGGIL